MKSILLLLVLSLSAIVYAQKKDTVIVDEMSGKPMLLGISTREALQDTNFSWWFNSAYKLYDVDSTALNKLKNKLSDIKITIIMGTWCSDSRREVPRFYKILDYLNVPDSSVKLIMVDRSLFGKGDEADDLNFKFVPTIIFYRSGKEIGRIVESPKQSLEKDMLAILTKK